MDEPEDLQGEQAPEETPDSSSSTETTTEATEAQASDKGGPPPFPDSYHKARKNYAVFSALLLAWELIGFELLPGSTLLGLKLDVKSPGAVPFVLVALVFYFAARYRIEWWQSDEARRALKASRWDLWIANGIAFLALGIVAFQAATRSQLFSPERATSVVLILVSMFGGSILSLSYLAFKIRKNYSSPYFAYLTCGVIILAVVVTITAKTLGAKPGDTFHSLSTLTPAASYVVGFVFTYRQLIHAKRILDIGP